MFQKFILLFCLFFLSLPVFALSPYLAGSLGLVNISNKQGFDNYRGVTGTAAVGYGGGFPSGGYLAGEIFAIPNTISLVNNNTMKTTWSVGVSFLPGGMIAEKTVGYLRLGFIRSRFTNENKNVLGAQIGLGLLENLCQNWDLRVEYILTRYRSFNGITNPISDGFNVGVVTCFN